MNQPFATLRLIEDGPLELKGEIILNGTPIGQEAWLCRCGASADKPWCDGSHRAAGRLLRGDAPRREGQPLPAAGGVLHLELRPNGPVRISGPLLILNAAGEVIDRTTEVFLCRCGASARQPYCDGSHKRCGFTAP